MLFHHLIEYSEPAMTTTQEQELFNRTAELLTDDKITPEQACSFIEKLRDAGIIADDILDPEPEQEQQKAFNEIAGILADWKITTEEACDLFKEWFDEWPCKTTTVKPLVSNYVSSV